MSGCAFPARGAEMQMVALEAVNLVAEEYGIPTGDLKPCIAYVLDGNTTASLRNCAFTLAIELRRLGRDASDVQKLLERWAKKVGFKQREVSGAVKSGFAKSSSGTWRYHPPGLQKKPGGRYAEVLGDVCAEVGCPANCPAFSKKYQGPVKETYERFELRGWAGYLRRRRFRSDIDVYRAICRSEIRLQLAPGAQILTTYRQLAELAEVHYTTVGDALTRLHQLGLIEFKAGSGDGPHARNRVASRVRRVVPIPRAPSELPSTFPLTTGSGRQPQISRTRQQEPRS